MLAIGSESRRMECRLTGLQMNSLLDVWATWEPKGPPFVLDEDRPLLTSPRSIGACVSHANWSAASTTAFEVAKRSLIVTRQVNAWSLPRHRGVKRYTGQQARAAHLSPDIPGGRAIITHLVAR